jgi:maltodextrin utilization protein YvdJ
MSDEDKEKNKEEIKKEMKDKMEENMEQSLHDQFAENYNQSYSASITLFCTLLAVLYGYGCVFINSTSTCALTIGKFKEGSSYTLNALVFTTLAALVVLCIIEYVCMIQGVKIRKDNGERIYGFTSIMSP